MVGAYGTGGRGRASVFFGSAAGRSAVAAWIADGDQAGASSGNSVSTAGGVNGHGYSDVIVGAHTYDNGETDEGRAFVYLGSATGLSTSPAWTAESNQAGAYLGVSGASAGDVNGDGYSDVIVGAHYYDGGQANEGRAFVYLGSASGLAASPAWTGESNQAEARFGISVAGAGDVNGDGFSDVIVGADRYDNATTDAGRAFVYLGSATGLSATPAWAEENGLEVVEFLSSIPPRLLQTVQSVCCDLWEAYTEAVREEIPTVRIVVDRFHVAKHYHQAAEQVRKQELQRLKQILPKEEYQKLQGSMHAFRKNAQDLNKEERKILRGFFQHSTSAKQAYDFREQLTAIFEMNLSKKQAQSKIRDWIRQVQKSGLQCYDNFLKLLDTWWEEITNYFVQRETSGFVEGFNNKVKVLKRRCYGIFNLQHLFQRIYLDLHGYQLFAATTISA